MIPNRRPAFFTILLLWNLGALFLLAGTSKLFCILFATPSPWFFGALAILGVAVTSPLRRHGLRRTALSATMVFGLAVSSMGLPWGRREEFLWNLDRIHPGMTREEVARIMGEYAAGTGWTRMSGAIVTVPGCEVFRWTDNADWGVVCYCQELVRSAEFWMD